MYQFVKKNFKALAESLTVVTLLVVTLAYVGIQDAEKKEQYKNVEISEHAVAGISALIVDMETAEPPARVTVDSAIINTVAASLDTIAEENSYDPEWVDKLMPDVDEYMNVRTEPSSDSAVAGKLRKGDLAEIVGHEDGWTEITSGNLTGYVNDDYAITGDDAKEYALETCLTYVKSTAGGLRVRSSAGEDGDVLTALGEGDKLEFAADAEAVDGWVAVKYKDSVGYVKEEYADTYLATGKGITVEEEQQALKKAEEEKAAKAAASAQKSSNSVATVQNQAVAASYDDVTLLAALIQCEAGYEPYEGQLAVGAVVVNRLRTGYGGSMYDVIYARGQFTPAGSGKVAAVAAAGPRASCIQAASEALAGVDNTGGARYFRPSRTGHAGLVIGSHVFW